MFGRPLARDALEPLVGDLRQLASVRRIVLDDGVERGVRAIAFSTGGGLDFWVLADRSLDIGPAWWRGTPVAWQSPGGFRSPALHDAESEGGQGFGRSFSGLLVTCGLDHTRQPKDGRPLHGRLPFTPARVQAYGEDWDRKEPVLFCEGEVTQSRLGGEALRLRRRIEAPIGGNLIRIVDEVTNLGSGDQQQALLYHINLGFPFVATGTELLLGGERLLGPLRLPQPGMDPAVTCRSVDGSGWTSCEVRTPAEKEGRTRRTSVAFDSATLPWLQTWLEPRPQAHVLGIEPCTSDRGSDGRSGVEPILPAHETRRYRLELAFGED